MTTGRTRAAVLAIFVLSGAAGLIDEIVWSRQLVLVFGNTTQAVSAILTGFFGGMAIGALVGGRVVDRVRSPLRLYGLLEITLFVVVLITPVTFTVIRELYRGLYPSLQDAPQALALLRFALSLLALAPATVLMGATLPALTRHLTREGHPSAAFGRLYAANTVGAIIGTAAAGFVLIEVLGLSGALAVGAACSGIAGVAALLMARREVVTETTAATEAVAEPVPISASGRPSVDPPGVSTGRLRLALAVAFGSGLTSLGYQVLWTRLLASGTGNTTYVFTVILVLFLSGLAIGALIFAYVRPRMDDPIRLLSTSQLLTAALVVLGLVGIISRPQLYDPMQPLETIVGLIGTAIPVVFVTTIVLGLTLPAASMLLPPDASRVGRSAGALLGVNTLGSITGSFLVPFLLIPLIGSPQTLVLLALVNVGIGVAIANVDRSSARTWKPSSVSLVAITLALAIVGTLLIPTAIRQPNEARLIARGGVLFEATEDEIATVEAGQVTSTPELWVAGTSMTLLTVDAKLMPLLPLAARPGATEALAVAFGMGSSFRTGLIAGLQTEVVELVPSVPDMFHWYYPDAEGVLADPNGQVIIADGRNHLELTDRRYDIIVTDPPPPIESSGASVISSLEYYRAGQARLKPGGIMMQWVPFGSTVAEYQAHVRTFASVYDHVTIAFGPGGYGSFLLGSAEPMDLGPEALASMLERPGVLDDLRSAYDNRADTVDGWVDVLTNAQWISDAEVDAFAGDGPMVTDDRPIPEYFLLRRWRGDGSPPAVPSVLLGMTSGS